MSTEIKSRIKNITTPLAERQGTVVLQGEVLAANEKTNSCKIRYIKKDSTKAIKENVQVMLSNNGVIDWFPEKGETVLIQERDGAIFIMGPGYSDYSEVRRAIRPKKDLLADTFGSFFGGQIF